jgi:glycosyltransferase involved in cell wall biosynthesis
MKILFISLLLPHPYADHACAFTVFKTTRHLSQRHDISLIAFVRSEKEREFVRHLEDYCMRVETVLLPQNSFRKFWVRSNLMTLKPIAVSHGYCREMRDRVQSMIRGEKFHIVQIEYTPMGQYVSEVLDSATIINVHDLVFVQAKRFVENLRFSRKKLGWFIDGLISRHYESRLYAKFDRVLAMSQKIKENLLDCNPSLSISVIPSGVDIPKIQKSHALGKGSNLIFMGAMWRPENIDAVLYFYRSVLELIRKAIPEVSLTIVGGSPSEEVKRLALDPGVKVTGYVEDLLPCYLKSDVSIAPMRIAGGVQCKILDAMAAGLPVVTSSAGNEGIGAGAHEEIIVADNPEEFADRTIELLQNGYLRRTISERGLDFVRRNFSWEQIIGRLEKIYQECLLSQNLE